MPLHTVRILVPALAVCLLAASSRVAVWGANPKTQAITTAPAVASYASAISPPDQTTALPLGRARPAVIAAAVGSPKQPGSPLKSAGALPPGVGGNASDRAAEVQRLMNAYRDIAMRYADGLVLAASPEDKEKLAPRAPSAAALRPIAVLLLSVVATDPTDEPALDALVFLSKYIGVPEIDAAFAGEFERSPAVDPLACLSEHHASNPKVVEALQRIPASAAKDSFARTLFENSFEPKVRWAAGVHLVASLARDDRKPEVEALVRTMAGDRYLEGVVVGRENARKWAADKLRELQTLGVGKMLPEVGGERLDGAMSSITDYRGRVVVLDIWTTWCGPCVAMIPEQVKMTERLKDKPFVLLSVSCDQDKATLTEFLERTSMPWEHWWIGPDNDFKETLNIHAYPTIFVLDKKGVIRFKNIRHEELEDAVLTLLEETE